MPFLSKIAVGIVACLAATVPAENVWPDRTNDAIEAHRNGGGPNYTKLIEHFERPDPVWTVMVAPGHPPKDFTAICADRRRLDRVHCMVYPDRDPMSQTYYYVSKEQWKKCVNKPHRAGKTPDASCLNWSNWHEDDEDDGDNLNERDMDLVSIPTTTNVSTTLITRPIVTVTKNVDERAAPNLGSPTGATQTNASDSNEYQVRRDAPVKPENFPDFEPNTPMPYYFHSGHSMSCTYPINGTRSEGTIYCFGRDERAPLLVFQPEDSENGRYDLQECYRNEDRCSGDFEIFHHHDAFHD